MDLRKVLTKGCAAAWLVFATAMAAVVPGHASEPSFGTAVRTQYTPRCSEGLACDAWRRFRAARPFPVQTIAGHAGEGQLVLIFSEPSLGPQALAPMMRTAFGEDLVQLSSHRWAIGADGWLEDVVVTLRWPGKPTPDEWLRDAGLRDRLAVLAQQLWGTPFGLEIEPVARNLAERARGAVPNLDPRPNELQIWLSESQRRWQRIDRTAPGTLGYTQLAASGEGTWASTDGQLVVMALPPGAIGLARSDREAFAKQWRAAFRTFATASDLIVGAAWHSQGSLLLVGRTRQLGPDVMPPLRFETFATLVQVDSRELAQSYERSTPFAGKLGTGPFKNADWAPIYLSDALVDTEFGALLNITDQMLKSWSSAGQIDYLYFDYAMRPREGEFVFGSTPIADIVRRETGSTQVLFNWNTAGAASVTSLRGAQVLTPSRIGALPVTYGAELKRGEGVVSKIDALLSHENAAYRYFSSFGDPNLARVVAYTTLYQALDAFKESRGLRPPRFTVPVRSLGAMSRRAALVALADDVAEVLTELDAPDAQGRLTHRMVERLLARARERDPQAELEGERRTAVQALATRVIREALGDTPQRLRDMRGAHPQARETKALALLLVDRNEVQRLAQPLFDRQVAWRVEVDRFNAAARSGQLTQAQGTPWRSRLEAARAAWEADLDTLHRLQADLVRLTESVTEIVRLTRDLEATRQRFVNAARGPGAALGVVDGWIRTPSIVVSWDRHDTRAIGGHNLDAHALRIEVDPRIAAPAIERSSNGRTLRVPPSLADAAHAQAGTLARRIEHEALDATRIQTLLSATTTAPPRALHVALKLDGSGVSAGGRARHTGTEALDDVALRKQLLAEYQRLEATGVVAWRSADGHFVVAGRSEGQIQCCERILDFVSLRDRLARSDHGGRVMLVNFPERQARALQRNLSGPDDAVLLEAVGGSGGGGFKPPEGTVHALGGEPAAGSGRHGGPAGPGGPGGPGAPGGPRGPGGPGDAGGGTGGVGGGRPGSGPPLAGTAGDVDFVGLMPHRGTFFESMSGSHRVRRLESVSEPLTGEQAVADLARLPREVTVLPGKPVVYQLSWVEAAEGRGGVQSRVLAGVDPAREQAGAAVVGDAIRAAMADQATQSLNQFHARVRDLVNKHRDRRSVWALHTWVDESRVSYLLSEASRTDDRPAPDR